MAGPCVPSGTRGRLTTSIRCEGVPSVRDLFREGAKLGESLARLPWEAARRMVGGKSETLKQAADLGERLGTLPFRAAGRFLGEEPRTGGGGGVPPRSRGRIVVLGAGYAGLTCFLELQDHLSREYDLVLVNGDKYHWFTTELHTYVAGEEEDAVRVPLSRVVAPPGRLVVGRVTRVDTAAKQVEVDGGERLDYDLLVFALGSDPEFYGLPGAAEHGMIVGNYHSAGRLRKAVDRLMGADGSQSWVPHIAIVGGGLTGVEVAGELSDEHTNRLRLTIVEAGPEIMAGFAPELVATARDVLQAKGIEVRTGAPIVSVEKGRLHFKVGDTLEYDLLVWAGGVRGNSILAKSGFDVTPKGRARTDAFLRAVGHADVYVAGDSAAFTDPDTGREVGPTAQSAVQMGRWVGRNILRRLRGHAEEPFVPLIRGSFASLGRQQGVGQIGDEQYKGVSAMLIKNLVEAHHAWETGGGVMPLVRRLVRGPQRFLRGRVAVRQRVATAAARPEAPRRT